MVRQGANAEKSGLKTISKPCWLKIINLVYENIQGRIPKNENIVQFNRWNATSI